MCFKPTSCCWPLPWHRVTAGRFTLSLGPHEQWFVVPCSRDRDPSHSLGSVPGATTAEPPLIRKYLRPRIQSSDPASREVQWVPMPHSSLYQPIPSHPWAEAHLPGSQINNNNPGPSGSQPVRRTTWCLQTFVLFTLFIWLKCTCFYFRQMLVPQTFVQEAVVGGGLEG